MDKRLFPDEAMTTPCKLSNDMKILLNTGLSGGKVLIIQDNPNYIDTLLMYKAQRIKGFVNG